MGGYRSLVGIRLSYRPDRLHMQDGGIGSLELIPGLLKGLPIPSTLHRLAESIPPAVNNKA